MKTIKTCLAATCVCLLANAAHATIVPVSNSSFEFVPSTNGSCCTWGDFPDPTVYPANSTWVDTNGYGNGGYATNGAGDHFFAAPDGSGRYLYLANVGSVTQDLNTLITPGEKVSLSFFDGNDRDGSSGYGSHIGGGIIDATIMIGAQTVSANFDRTTGSPGVWFSETLNAQAAVTGDLKISFSAASGTPWMDAVSVSVTPAPEPTSMVLLGLGAVGLFAAARRRRTA